MARLERRRQTDVQAMLGHVFETPSARLVCRAVSDSEGPGLVAGGRGRGRGYGGGMSGAGLWGGIIGPGGGAGAGGGSSSGSVTTVEFCVCVYEGAHSGGHFVFHMHINEEYPFRGPEVFTNNL
jgi:hypothetical protein